MEKLCDSSLLVLIFACVYVVHALSWREDSVQSKCISGAIFHKGPLQRITNQCGPILFKYPFSVLIKLCHLFLVWRAVETQ